MCQSQNRIKKIGLIQLQNVLSYLFLGILNFPEDRSLFLLWLFILPAITVLTCHFQYLIVVHFIILNIKNI